MHPLLYDLKTLVFQRRTSSYATQANRHAMLQQMGRHLLEAGYSSLRASQLKGRHVNALLARWQADGLTPATIKNRMAALRWWARTIGNPGALKASNAAYGIPTRVYVACTSKARALPPDQLQRVTDRAVRMSLALQRAFGLRREESIKLQPWQADQGDRLVLQGSWCKGGRPRTIPLTTDAQRAILDEAKALVRFKEASLIPKGSTYVQQLHRYEQQCRKAGLDHMHGLRHAYAQHRFVTLAGFACPADGGPSRAALTPQQREADYDARVLISAELGHGREAITAAYLGR